MSRALAAKEAKPASQMPDWFAPGLLIIGTALIGGHIGGAIRPIFILGCVIVGWFAWRKGPASHFYAALLLFSFAPFVRRVVDVSAGYSENGLMLLGPLFAIMIPGIDLVTKWTRTTAYDKRLSPIILSALCAIYATILTMAQGEWSMAMSATIKGMAPLIYGMWLVIFAKSSEEILDAAASAFLIILPITGLYALYQYVDPPLWDQYWMKNASIMSAGQPVPYGVRPFSTLNGPASYATFTTAGLMFTLFLGHRKLLSTLVMAPAFMGLMLSQYRTAWIALAVGILFCSLFSSTRYRAVLVLIGGFACGLLALSIPPFSDVIGDRLATLGQGGQDGSAQERLLQYIALWATPDSTLFGVGYTTVDVGTAGAMPVDGMIIASWLSMGIPVGILCLVSFLWPMATAVGGAIRAQTPNAVIVGAFAMGALIQLPLANLSSAELGFLFWSIILQTPKLRRVKVQQSPMASRQGSSTEAQRQKIAKTPVTASLRLTGKR